MLKRLKEGADPLELSIEKWQDIADGKGRNNGAENCALCETNSECDTCLIFLKKHVMCSGTPFHEYFLAKTVEARHYFALEEVDFLKSLRTKEVLA